MASSDDDGDMVVQDVSDFRFEDGKDEVVSLAELPIVWGKDEASGGEVREIFLRGYTDNHLSSVYRQVKAWRFDISLPNPEISVLSSESRWIKLLQPRKSYLEFVRTIIITVHFLHLLKNKPDIPPNDLWDKLSKNNSCVEKPCENDLVEQISLIREAVKRDKNLKDSNVLIKLLKNQREMRVLDKGIETSKMTSSIIDDSVVDGTNMNDAEKDDFDEVCALCDNGGDLLSCEGSCFRSFHATTEAGLDTQCKSLGLSDEKLKGLPMFLCNNCKYKKHQCYACGQLGSSDESSVAEVFRCTIATCGHFYHPHCVAKLLFPRNNSKMKELRGKISTGEQFTCPIHECYICKEGENKLESDLQFAVCRRCPKSYHRKCLPREIAFDGDEHEEFVTRAWEGLLANERILIYCLDHEIDEDLQTPLRNHIIFPGLDTKRKRVSTLSSGGRASLSSEGASKKRRLLEKSKAVEKLSSSEKQGDSSKKTEKRLSSQRSSGQCKAAGTAMKTSKNYSVKYKKIPAPEGGSDPDEPIHTGELEPAQLDGVGLADSDSSMDLDPDAIERILNIIQVTASEVTMEEIGKKCKMPGTRADKLKAIVDRLHWYVQDGDTIVDFCCGSNDFSLILKQKLDEMGKICSYKNYDVHLPKNDFSFEKRDWMTVHPDELPSGSNLIVGLNPPFGEANKFISKALELKPKILILTVPRETDRLDGENMEFCYDLLWEDDELLTGKSFYSPGSMDGKGKQMEDSNVSAQRLHLWSRTDWTCIHKSIAEEKGHIMGMPVKVKVKVKVNKNHNRMMKSTPPSECTKKSSMRVNDQKTEHGPHLEQRASVPEKEKSSGTENSQKRGSQSCRMLTMEGELGNKMEDNSAKKSSAGERPWRGKPFHPEHTPVSGSNARRQARYGSVKEVDRRLNRKDTEDSVEGSAGRLNENNKRQRKTYLRNDTSSPALGHSFRKPYDQFLEGGPGKSSAGKQSHSHHPNSSLSKRFKGSPNRKSGKPYNTKHTPVSGPNTQCTGKDDERKSLGSTSSPALDNDSRKPHEQFLEGGQEKRMEETSVKKSPHRGHAISQSDNLGFALSHCSSFLNGTCGWIEE